LIESLIDLLLICKIFNNFLIKTLW